MKQTNRMEQLGAKRFAPGKGVTLPSPKKGVPRFFFLVTTYFWNLIGINLLFALCCLPIVTIPASLCALNRYLIKMVRDGFGFSVNDYWKEWKSQLLKSLPAGILCTLPFAYGYYLLSLSAGETGSGMVFAFGVFWALFGFLLSGYVFILLAMVNLPLKALFKNALILILTEWKTSLCVLALTSLTMTAAALLFPFSVPVLTLFLVAWVQLALCCAINEPVQKRILTPFEKQQKQTHAG